MITVYWCWQERTWQAGEVGWSSCWGHEKYSEWPGEPLHILNKHAYKNNQDNLHLCGICNNTHWVHSVIAPVSHYWGQGIQNFSTGALLWPKTQLKIWGGGGFKSHIIGIINRAYLEHILTSIQASKNVPRDLYDLLDHMTTPLEGVENQRLLPISSPLE